MVAKDTMPVTHTSEPTLKDRLINPNKCCYFCLQKVLDKLGLDSHKNTMSEMLRELKQFELTEEL